MKLRSVLKTMSETRYMITGDFGGKYKAVYLKIDYVGLTKEKFCEAIKERDELLKINPDVVTIRYNTAVKCIEIGIK